MKIKEITKVLEQYAPLFYQETYDNAGLIVGNVNQEVRKALLSFDVTEKIIDEAISIGADLIISHHPLVFSGLKKITGRDYIERCVIKAIKNDIAIYAVHTNIDNVINGTNKILAEKLGLKNVEILRKQSDFLYKLVVYVPENHIENIKKTIFRAGAGNIGKYDECCFYSAGIGSFKAKEGAKPFVGEINIQHQEKEYRIETIIPKDKMTYIVEEMINAHPYEEVAYDIFPLINGDANIGSGIIGDLEFAEEEINFLNRLKNITNAGCVKYTSLRKKTISKVALCGGSGAFLIKDALAANADIYITGDVKYHDFFIDTEKMVIADIGHYESEQFILDLLLLIIKENFATFAIQKSEFATNPVNYL